jgi:hypothetical protein
MLIFFESLLANIVIVGYGILAKKIFNLWTFSENFINNFFFGIIFLSYVGIFINIFIPLTSAISYIVISLGLFLFFFNFKNFFNKDFFYQIFFCSLIVFFLLVKSKVYDDFPLYYLPAITKITESNIVLGLSNIHFRFGHNFSMFYATSLFKNNLFDYQWSYLIPALIYANFIVFLIVNILKKKNNTLSFFLSLCLLSLYLVKFYDFGNHGLDIPASIYFFIIVFMFLKSFEQNIKDIEIINLLKKILIISLFLVTLKISFIPVLFFSFILIAKFWKKITFIKKKNIIIIFLPFLIWIFSNLLITSCIFYPKKEFCINLPWASPEEKWISSPDEVFIELSAWSKGWVDSLPSRSMIFETREDYISHQRSFLSGNWLVAYSHHFKNHVIKFIITSLIVVLFVTFYFRRRLVTINKSNKRFLQFLFLYSILASSYWFFTAPLTRFGFSQLFIFIFSLFLLIFQKTIYHFNLKSIKYFIIFLLFVFLARNLNGSRDNNFNNNFFRPYPDVFSKSATKYLPAYNTVSFDEGILNITNGRECFNIPSPCTQFSTIDISRIKIVKRWIFKSFEIKINNKKN